MIVNTAYIYMGSAGRPVNPVIFQQNEINYNYSGTKFTVTSNGYLQMEPNSELVFTGLDLSNFETLKITGSNDTENSRTLIVNFIDDSGNVSADISRSFSADGRSTRNYTIPTAYKKPKSKIKLTSRGRLLLETAILS